MKRTALTEPVWQYLTNVNRTEDPVLAALRAATAELPAGGMQIPPDQGQFMQFLVRFLPARRCLEVGCFTGYSSLAVALALPADGRVVTCDVSKEWTDMARAHWRRAGVADKIELKLGPATDTLQALIDDGQSGSFDFAFIDADKDNYVHYYEMGLALLRPGGLMLIDNVLWGGQVADLAVQDADTEGIRAVSQRAAADARVNACLLAIADGVHLCHKL